MIKKTLSTVFLLLMFFVPTFAQQVVLSGDITTDRTLTSDKTYLLSGFVRVKSGATLTIQPGTTIYGENSTQGSLIIQPGGKLVAIGTVANPIVFTSEFNKAGSTQQPTYGDWGGVILLGNAPINVPGGTSGIEGPGDTFGGNDPADSSGALKYVRIEYPGIAFSPNNEINGLTFGGVGNRTLIDYVQVSYSGDDSYEWFGGTVNAKHLIAYRGLDDDFDTDFGFQGKLQFLVGLRDPQIADVVSGSNGFESDNDGAGSVNTPRTSPTWWNVTLVGPQVTTTSTFNSSFKRGMHLRRSSQNKVNNALILGWPTGLFIDGTNTVADAKANVMFVKNSIIAGSSVNTFQTTDATWNVASWFNGNGGKTFTTNDQVQLRDPFSLENPNFLPKTGSSALTGGGTPPNDGFFDQTASYIGAFGSNNWTFGWAKFASYPKVQEVLSGDIISDQTLTSDKTYLLSGFVRVKSGATLTIQPGTTIYGENSTQGSLIIQPGGKLVAIGTVANPIVFTSEFNKAGSTQQPTYGDWGGVILLGNAPINVPGGTSGIEGPGDTFGGNDPADSSGALKYVRIEYPGIAFSPNNEINGLTFGGVGNRTLIDYVQVSYSGDDSYEWFGGTVNAKHLIAYRGLDDDFDTDFGFQGKLQFLVGLRDPQIADVVSGSNGFESDNDGAGSVNTPRTSPTWWNVTLVGPQVTTTSIFNSSFKRGMHLRRSSQNKVNNALILGWPTGLFIDGTNTVADAKANVMFVKNSIIAGSSVNTFQTTDATWDVASWFNGNGGRTFTTTSEVKLVDAFNLNFPNFLPETGSPALSGGGTPPNDGFFDQTSYVGAFNTNDWTFGWAKFTDATITDVEDIRILNTVPTNYELSQNYPNPFNPSTKIKFNLPEAGNVRINVYNMLGQLVKTLVNGFKSSGTYEINFNASNLTSGVYIYRLQTATNVISKKMVLLK